MISEAHKSKFLSLVNKTETCWIWTGCRSRGYGLMCAAGEQWRTHRLAWVIFRGEIPNSKCVLHSCDNPSCVNPDHLWIGTQLDNIRDMIAKGRAVYSGLGKNRNPPRGEDNGSSKLNARDVRTIRMRYSAGGTSFRQLAREFGLSAMSVHCIVGRKTWKHVP